MEAAPVLGEPIAKRLKGNVGNRGCCTTVSTERVICCERRSRCNRLMITGGSAGGYTTLCALTFRDVLRAGASHLWYQRCRRPWKKTHISLSHSYSDGLIGPYHETVATRYVISANRSTRRIFHNTAWSVPLLSLELTSCKNQPDGALSERIGFS